MKHKIFTALTVFFCLTNLSAQITKTDGPVGESMGKHDVQSIIGADNNSFYVYRREDEKIVVQGYNKATLTKTWETDISFKDKNIQSLDWRGRKLLYLKNGKIYLFIPAATNKKALLMLQVVNTDGKIDGNAKEIYSSDDETVTDKYQKRVIEYRYSLSNDSTKMVYWYSYNSSGTVTKTAVIDLKNFKKMPTEIPSKYEGNGIIPGNFAISNDGIVAFDFIYWANQSKIQWAWQDPDKPRLMIGIWNPASTEIKGILPDVGSTPKNYSGSAGIYFTNQNRFMATLILTDANNAMKRKDLNSGIFLGLFDAVKGTVEKQGFQYFSKAWRDKYLSNDKHNMVDDHWNAKPYEFVFTPVEGGSFILSAFDAGTAHEGGWGDRYMLKSWAYDGLVFKLNSGGSIEWTRILPMYLKYIFTGGVYENHFYYNKKMYYLYDDNNDNIKNVDLNNVETSKDTKETKEIDGKSINTICITYDMNGKAERTIIQNNKESGFLPLDKTVWADKNKILLYFKKGSKENFSTVTIQ